jgi:hypothetical protein
MTARAEEILGDPIFQLNVVLWALQPAPPNAPIRPVLREAGYLLSAISRDLPPPFELRPGLKELLGSDTPPAPDVLGEPPKGTPWLVVECKGSGFSPESSNARQAIKLLAVSMDLRSSLALPGDAPRPGVVAYLTLMTDRDQLMATLRELQGRLDQAGLPSGDAGVFGLALADHREGQAVVVAPCPDGDWPEPIAALVPEAPVILLGRNEDPRPLYLIPWDPSVQQSREMRGYCRAVLFARVAAEAVAVLGHETVPQRVVVKVEPLLSAATFGVSDRWRSRSDLSRTLRECKRFLVEALGPLRDQLAVAQPTDPERVELTIRSQDDLEQALEALLRADPFGGPPPEPEHQLSVLDPQEEP